MKQTDPQLKLRLPRELKVKIENAAASARRPLSGEIIARLERTFSEDEEHVIGGLKFFSTTKELAADDLIERLSALEGEVENLRAQVRALSSKLNAIKPA